MQHPSRVAVLKQSLACIGMATRCKCRIPSVDMSFKRDSHLVPSCHCPSGRLSAEEALHVVFPSFLAHVHGQLQVNAYALAICRGLDSQGKTV